MSPAFFASETAAPAVELAVNATLNEPAVALILFVPTTGPSVHDPTVAIPEEFVEVVAPETDPPPDATAKITDTPLAGLPFASFTITEGATETELPATAV